ncbi:MAG TPA: tetratricopeptide repeat protein [Ohtaekwangia sp.]|nr:tetratricopeptide repeat protein [Ohtaekwangia sp.]
MAKKVEHRHELLENPEALQEKLAGAETWLESNSKLVFGIAGGFILLVAGYFGFQYYKETQDREAQREMFQAIYYFEADSLSQALNGDGNNLGFLDVISDYGITEAANLAHFYTGAIYLKQGKFESAREHLHDFNSNDLLIQARAYSLIGDTYMEEKNYEEAANFYNKAANYKPNKFFSPGYLMKEALAYEQLNQNKKAKEVYDKVITQYWDSSEYQKARKLKARLDGNS